MAYFTNGGSPFTIAGLIVLGGMLVFIRSLIISHKTRKQLGKTKSTYRIKRYKTAPRPYDEDDE